MMQHYDRTKITEEPARVLVHRKPRIAPVIDADQSWKINYLRQLTESKKTGKPLSDIIQSDKSQADHIRIQNRIRDTIQIKDVSDLVIDGENRFSLRRMK